MILYQKGEGGLRHTEVALYRRKQRLEQPIYRKQNVRGGWPTGEASGGVRDGTGWEECLLYQYPLNLFPPEL